MTNHRDLTNQAGQHVRNHIDKERRRNKRQSRFDRKSKQRSYAQPKGTR